MCLFKPELKIVYSFKFFILKKHRRERNAKYCTNADAMGDEINLRMRFFLGGGDVREDQTPFEKCAGAWRKSVSGTRAHLGIERRSRGTRMGLKSRVSEPPGAVTLARLIYLLNNSCKIYGT